MAPHRATRRDAWRGSASLVRRSGGTGSSLADVCVGGVERGEPSALSRLLDVERGVILHVDDLGMCHGGNRAFKALHERGLVTCGSVMVPCPWFPEVAEAAAADPSMDLGVHLTLTSEWDRYRWRPVSTNSVRSGLIDPDGYFWRDVASLRRHMVAEAAVVELRTQVERAVSAGLRPTHMDAHMAAAMLPDLLGCHIALAHEAGAVPVLPRAISFAPDPAAYDRTVRALEAAGLSLPDGCRGTLAVPAGEARTGYRRLIDTLPAGITHLALHCAAPGDIEAITPLHAPWRIREYDLLAEGWLRDWCEAAAVTPIGYRRVQAAWRGGNDPSSAWTLPDALATEATGAHRTNTTAGENGGRDRD